MEKNVPAEKEENDKLIKLLEELIQLLRFHSENFWAKWFDEALERCRRFDPYGLIKIMNAYGGMGSINDLNIRSCDGHGLDELKNEKDNKHFKELKTQIYTLTKDLLLKVDSRDRQSRLRAKH